MASGKMPPNSVTLVIDDTNHMTAYGGKAHGRPGGPFVFVIYNLDNRSHFVRIPPTGFAPHPPKGTDPGPDDPMVHSIVHWASVDAGDAAVVQLKARPAGHFPEGNWTYKYTAYWADDIFGTNEHPLDPEIEINN